MTKTIERESQERFKVRVVSDIDPTSEPVEFAFTFIEGSVPRPDVWFAGAWDVDTLVDLGGSVSVYARTPLIGSGALDLEPGTYQVWVRFTSALDVPVVKVERLRVL